MVPSQLESVICQTKTAVYPIAVTSFWTIGGKADGIWIKDIIILLKIVLFWVPRHLLWTVKAMPAPLKHRKINAIKVLERLIASLPKKSFRALSLYQTAFFSSLSWNIMACRPVICTYMHTLTKSTTIISTSLYILIAFLRVAASLVDIAAQSGLGAFAGKQYPLHKVRKSAL